MMVIGIDIRVHKGFLNDRVISDVIAKMEITKLLLAVSTNPLIAPLTMVLIGGLISSTLLLRKVTPVVYKLIPTRVAV